MKPACLAVLAFFFFPGFLAWSQDPGFVAPAGQDQAKPDGRVDQVEALPEPGIAELRQLVGGLGSESFDIRERSQAALSKYAERYPVMMREGLAKDYVDSLDPEIRYRLAEVLFDAVVEDMDHSGFLGIIMRQSHILVGNEMVASIEVGEILRDSAAARAGLQLRDQIVQVDELTFDPQPLNRQPVIGLENTPNLLKFKDYIGGRKKGTEVTLKVYRQVNDEPRVLEVPVRLGRRSRELMEASELHAEEQFFEKWLNEKVQSQPKNAE